MSEDNLLNYTNYDWATLNFQLQDRLSKTSWQDAYESSTGKMLIELYSYVANMILYYIERRAEESYIKTARNKSSVINLVRLLNYTPRRPVSSTGAVRFAIPAPATKTILIPRYTMVATSSGLKFTIIEGVNIDIGKDSVDVTAIQGEVAALTPVTGTGVADMEIAIPYTNVENDTHTNLQGATSSKGTVPFSAFAVTVDGIPWNRVTSFLASGASSKEYILRAELDDTLTVVFGDGISGVIPPNGSTIQITCILSDGMAGNVYDKTDTEAGTVGSVNTIINTLYYSDASVVTESITVTNTSNMVGGDDAETVEEIREHAPQVFATGDRGVTKGDFIAIVEDYPTIAGANVWGEMEENPPNYDMFNTIRICMIQDSWTKLTDQDKRQLADDLYTKWSLVTVKFEFIDPTIIELIAVVDAQIYKGTALSQAQTLITNALDAQFDLIAGTAKLGKSKYRSNLIRVIDLLSCIAYHHLTLEVREQLAEIGTSSDWTGTTDLYPITEHTVKIYVGDTLIATDDGVGSFTDVSSSYTVSGTVTYGTAYAAGVVNVDITPKPTDYPVYIRYIPYNATALGDIICSPNQICRLADVEFTSTVFYEG